MAGGEGLSSGIVERLISRLYVEDGPSHALQLSYNLLELYSFQDPTKSNLSFTVKLDRSVNICNKNLKNCIEPLNVFSLPPLWFLLCFLLTRFGETNMKFVSYKMSEVQGRRSDKESLVSEDNHSVHTNISLQVPIFEERLNGRWDNSVAIDLVRSTQISLYRCQSLRRSSTEGEITL